MKKYFGCLLVVGMASAVFAETQIDLRKQARVVDFSGALPARPFRSGAVLAGEVISARALCGGCGAVSTVFGRGGAIRAQAGDYSLAQLTGTAFQATPQIQATPWGGL